MKPDVKLWKHLTIFFFQLEFLKQVYVLLPFALKSLPYHEKTENKKIIWVKSFQI